jgi:hypothetical protein
VGVVGIPEQPGLVGCGEGGHPPVAEGRLECVFSAATHAVYLVDEQHAETSQAKSLNLDSEAENLVSSEG